MFDGWKIRESLAPVRDESRRAVLAAGLLIPVAGAVLAGSGGGVSPGSLLKISLLGLLSGLAGLVFSRGGRSEVWRVFLPILAAAAVSTGYFFPVLIPGSGAASAGVTFLWFLVFLSLGGLAGGGLTEPGEAYRAALPGVLILALGVLLTSLLLTWLGPFLMTAAALVLLCLPFSPRRVIPAGALILSLLLLFPLAWLDGPGRERGEKKGAARVIHRRWYVDGPAGVVVTGPQRADVQLAGGRVTWEAYPPGSKRKGEGRDPSPSAKLARSLVTGKPSLVIGPAAATEFLKVSGKGYGARVIIPGARRLTEWLDLGISARRRSAEEGRTKFRSGSVRSFLKGREELLGLIYLVDLYRPGAVSSGAAARRPAYDLTMESFQLYLNALAEDGALVMEVPYGLKVAGILKEMEVQTGRDLKDLLNDNATTERIRDIVIYRKKPFEITDIRILNWQALTLGLEVHYYPNWWGEGTAFTRLVASQRPRGFYIDLATDLRPPKDKRPFFYRVSKALFLGPGGSGLSSTTPRSWKMAGIISPEDLSWIFLVFLGLCVLAGSMAGVYRDRNPADEDRWEVRAQAFFLLTGSVLGMILEGGRMFSWRGTLAHYPAMTAGVLVMIGGIAAGMRFVATRRAPTRKLLLWGTNIIIPVLALPLLAGLMPERLWSLPGGVLFMAATTLPGIAVGGMILWAGLILCCRQSTLTPAAALAVAGLGVLTGLEMAPPVAQSFGLPFVLVLSWGVLFVAVRTVNRIPDPEGLQGGKEPRE